ncbi:putative Pentatricopeptide repeat-containing protein [Hibiscus syriacus]|uniref:Pentatricopeptide repeat-containing protein n=1 Tax=Hibiscus syriacus TaxID=106335 RepID=A0A6A3BGD8_HIBSY|nr:putative Pentatricopeptide repeat-containing protein [Hibiscus syriacus]
MFEQVYKVFDEMPNRGLLSFNALMGACVNARKLDKVDVFLKELPEKLSIKPDLISYNTVIKALCEMGSLDSARLMLYEMEKKGVQPDVITFNMLIYDFFSRMEAEKRMKETANLVEEMRSNGVKLDVFTLNYMIRSDFTFAIELCKEILDRKKLVGAALLQRVVDDLVEASKIEDAKELLKLANTNSYCRYKLNMPAE